MSVEKHDLEHEKPESKETILHLKTHDHHFARLYEDYQGIETEVHRFETGAENTSAEHLEDLKKQRLILKDQLFSIIHRYESSSTG